MTLREALKDAAARLEAVSDTPRLDAELLAAFALGCDRNTLLLHHLDGEVPAAFNDLVSRRLTAEPVAYITGARDFWSLGLKVAPGVLIPRPDSETLIEAALQHFGEAPPRSILDLGTGSGALLLAALSEFREARGLGIDRSATALAIAAKNAGLNGLAERAVFQEGNWGQGIEGPFDLILCNPPYIETGCALPRDVAAYEPAEALFAGADGLDDYRTLAPQIARLLASPGCACVEIGHDQGESAAALFRAEGLNVVVLKDLGARDRCLVMTKIP